MFDALEPLAEAIARLDVPVDPDAVAELLALRDLLSARVTEVVGELDDAGLWGLDAATSLTSWLRHRANMSSGEASRLSRTARFLRALPETRAAYADGRLSHGQVEAIVSNLSERTVPLFGEHERDLLPLLTPLPASDLGRAMQTWRARAEALLDDPEHPEEAREVYLNPSLDGRWHGSLTLDAEAGAVVGAALRLAETPDLEAEPERSAARRRADALVDVCRFFLDHQQTKTGGRHRPHVSVVVTLDELEQRQGGRLVDGATLPASTVERLLCDCTIHRVITDGGSSILDYGRSTRTVPVNLFASLVLRDEHCRHPGCDRDARWCDAHHVVPWEAGGETSLANLVLKCSRHHHLGHQAGWVDKLLPDGTYEVTDPSGRTARSSPPGLLVPLAS